MIRLDLNFICSDPVEAEGNQISIYNYNLCVQIFKRNIKHDE